MKPECERTQHPMGEAPLDWPAESFFEDDANAAAPEPLLRLARPESYFAPATAFGALVSRSGRWENSTRQDRLRMEDWLEIQWIRKKLKGSF